MDPLLWILPFFIPTILLAHGWSYYRDKYLDASELLVFQVSSAGFFGFVLVWRCIQPLAYFYIPVTLILTVSVLWVPLTYRAIQRGTKTYCWQFCVYVSPFLYISTALTLMLHTSRYVGDNICIGCAVASAVCQCIYAHIVTLPRLDAYSIPSS